ncbi:hypothetical protein ICE98_03309 [Lactococcus lactis]|nr:hypothetical protein [Lactococcus lactis]
MIKIYNTDEIKNGYDFYVDIAMRINKKRNIHYVNCQKRQVLKVIASTI